MQDKEIIKLIHYSTTKGLSELDVNKMGTGFPGRESKYGVPIIKRTYFYLEGTSPEAWVVEVSIAKYIAILTTEQKLYDIGTDAEKIRKKVSDLKKSLGECAYVTSDEFHQAVKEAGYYGFYNPYSGLPNAVALYYSHPVEEVPLLI